MKKRSDLRDADLTLACQILRFHNQSSIYGTDAQFFFLSVLLMHMFLSRLISIEQWLLSFQWCLFIMFVQFWYQKSLRITLPADTGPIFPCRICLDSTWVPYNAHVNGGRAEATVVNVICSSMMLCCFHMMAQVLNPSHKDEMLMHLLFGLLYNLES